MLGDLSRLEELDPERIYIENVRYVFNVSHAAAARYCETAVRQGLFRKYIEVSCPDGSVAASAPTEQGLPEFVRCYRSVNGFVEEEELPTRDLDKTVFYRLTNGESESAEAHA